MEPAGDESIREKLDAPRSAGLLASPRRLAVGPDERKRVRLVARKVPTTMKSSFSAFSGISTQQISSRSRVRISRRPPDVTAACKNPLSSVVASSTPPET